MTMHKNNSASLADVLPIQDHYYLLHDGSRYAQHGTEDAHGLLIFGNLESAEQFCRTVGVGLPEFQPVRASVDEVFVLAIETGAICIAQGASAIVVPLAGARVAFECCPVDD